MNHKRSVSIKNSWNDLDVRQKRSVGISKSQLARSNEISTIAISLWKNDDYRRKQQKTRTINREKKRETWPEIKCLQCEQKFKIYPCRQGIKKFCKRECQTIYRTGRQNLKNRGRAPSRRAGSGISGSYHGKLFRSLYELSFMINVLEANNIEATYETLHIPVNDKHYIPDFVSHQTKTIYEIKYAKALTHLNVVQKLEAAKRYAEKIGYRFEIYTEQRMKIFSLDEVIEMVKSGDVELHLKKNGGVIYRRLIKKLNHQ